MKNSIMTLIRFKSKFKQFEAAYTLSAKVLVSLMTVTLLSACDYKCFDNSASELSVEYGFGYLYKHDDHYHFEAEENYCQSANKVTLEVLNAEKKQLSLSCNRITSFPLDLNKDQVTILFKTQSATKKLTINYKHTFYENNSCGLSHYVYHDKSDDVSTLISQEELHQIEIRNEDE